MANLGENITYQDLYHAFQQAYIFTYQKSILPDIGKYWKKNNSEKVWSKSNLENFRSDKILTKHLDDHEDFPISSYVSFVNEITEDQVLSLMDKINVGNANLIKFKNVFLDYNKMFAAYWFDLLIKHSNPMNRSLNYLEIGGGFGQLAEIFLRKTNFKIILIDLPEQNLLSAYYLKELHPNKKFLLFDTDKLKLGLTQEILDNYDVVIIPPGVSIDVGLRFDYFVNTRSMMEMKSKFIEKYFEIIQNHSKVGSYFLNVNRYEKNATGEPVQFAEYPYDAHWEVVVSHPSIIQNHIHLILTKRLPTNEIGDIREELRRIGLLGEPYYVNQTKIYSLAKYIDRYCLYFLRQLRKFVKILFNVINHLSK